MSKQLLTVVVDKQEFCYLDEHCARSGKTRTDVIRDCLRSLASPSDDAFRAEISRLSQEVAALKQEKTDLEIRLEMTTEHSDTVEALRQSEEWFRTIAEATPTPILICRVSEAGTILYANVMAGNTFGLPVDELVGRPIIDFYLNPAERLQTLTLIQQTGQIQSREIQLRRADGTPFWVTASLRQLTFNSEPTTLSALFDISDRKYAEDALRLAEAKYRGIFENAIEGIFQSTPDGRYISVNPAMARLFGYDSTDDMMATVNEIGRQIYVNPECRDRLRGIIETQGEIHGFECQAYCKDGSIIWISESTRAVYDTSGKLLYFEGIVEDITERKRAEETLRRQVEELRIEIDQGKRANRVAEITQTDYFQQLQAEVEQLRHADDSDWSF
jgi:PAS domain S-box-containing protein